MGGDTNANLAFMRKMQNPKPSKLGLATGITPDTHKASYWLSGFSSLWPQPRKGSLSHLILTHSVPTGPHTNVDEFRAHSALVTILLA